MRKASTKNLYEKNYKRMKEYLGDSFRLGELKTFMAALKPATQLSYVQSFIILENIDSGPFHDYFLELKALADNKAKKKTEAEKANWADWATIEKVRDLQEDETFAQLLMALYTYLPPLRPGELIETKLTDDGKSNYFDADNSMLIIRNGKTMKNKPPRQIPIPEELKAIIMNFPRERGTAEDNLLLGRFITSSGINRSLTRLFDYWTNKKIGPSLLRKIYISEHLPKLKDEERKTLAYVMGHDITTQQFIYNKN
jgi:integrase